MSDQKPKPTVLSQVAAPVVVALLVGGTAPWWWAPVASWLGIAVPQATGSILEQAHTASRTPHSLPGDAIVFFRHIESSGKTILVDLDYAYNPLHGSKVLAAVWLQDLPSGFYQPVYLPQIGVGTARIKIFVSGPGTAKSIRFTLFEYGKVQHPFAERTFPFYAYYE